MRKRTLNGKPHERTNMPAYHFSFYRICTNIQNAHVDVLNVARGLTVGLLLHLYPYFVYASSEDSGESTHMRRLA